MPDASRIYVLAPSGGEESATSREWRGRAPGGGRPPPPPPPHPGLVKEPYQTVWEHHVYARSGIRQSRQTGNDA